MSKFSLLLAAALGLPTFGAHAASLVDLFGSVPPPPTDVATALSWVKDGQVIAPDVLRLQQMIKAERATMASSGSAPAIAGPLNPDIADAPEVKLLIRGYNVYLAANLGDSDPAIALTKRSRWIQRAKGGQQANLLTRMAPCPEPCQKPEYLEQRRRLVQQELILWETLFKDWRDGRAKFISKAQNDIAATGEGAKALTAECKAAVAQYRAAMLDEIERELGLTELSVKRAEAFERGTSYLTPDAVSGASKKTKAP
jgi:hypothetical protein